MQSPVLNLLPVTMQACSKADRRPSILRRCSGLLNGILHHLHVVHGSVCCRHLCVCCSCICVISSRSKSQALQTQKTSHRPCIMEPACSAWRRLRKPDICLVLQCRGGRSRSAGSLCAPQHRSADLQPQHERHWHTGHLQGPFVLSGPQYTHA